MRVGATSVATLAVVGAVALVAGCSDSGSNTSSATSTAAPVTETVTASAPAPAAPATSATPTTNTPVDRSQCHAASLTGSIGQGGGGAAGSTEVDLVLTNSSDAGCSLRGYPGVSFVGDDNGTQIGAPATRRDDVEVTRVWLTPGTSAHASLRIAQAGNYDPAQCQPSAVDGFRVYPPDDTASLFIRYPQPTGCRSASVTLLTVGPLTR